MEEKKYPIGGFAPGNYQCKCVSCKEFFIGDKRAVQCEDCATKEVVTEEKEYWKQLNEEYNVFPNGEIMDGDLDKWIKKDREQSEYLINRYGESAWNIHRFMELCRAEDISESFFCQLVRYEIDKCLKRLSNEQ